MKNFDARFVPGIVCRYHSFKFWALIQRSISYVCKEFMHLPLTGRILVQILPWSERLCSHILLHVLCLDSGEAFSVFFGKGNKCTEMADAQSLLLDCKLIRNDSARPCAGEQ